MFSSNSVRRMSSRRRGTGQSFRPQLEALEERTLLAGDLDLSFGPNGTGKATWSGGFPGPEIQDRATAVAIKKDILSGQDGGFVTAYTRLEPGESSAGMWQFTADGLPDDSIEHGYAYDINYVDAEVHDIAIQDDGKIVVVGAMHGYRNEAGVYVNAPGFFVARFDPDNTRDGFFGGNPEPLRGVSIIPFDGKEAEARGVAIQEDGKIVVAGTVHGDYYETERDGLTLLARQDMIGLTRLLPNGSLDSSFGDGGIVTTSFEDAGFDSVAGTDVALQGEGEKGGGKIVVVGTFPKVTQFFQTRSFAVARYDIDDGSLDTTFGIGGKVVQPLPGTGESFGNAGGSSVFIEPGGDILVAGAEFEPGQVNEHDTDFALLRLESDGSDGSLVQTDLGSNVDYAASVVAMPSGHVVVGGWANAGGGGRNFALARYTPSGDLDASFGNDGIVLTDFEGGPDEIFDIGLQNGKIVAVGRAGDKIALARYHNEVIVNIAGYTGLLDDYIVSLTGGAGDDKIALIDKGGGSVEFRTLDGRSTVSLHNVQQILINGLEGDDELVIQQLPGGRFGPDDVPLVVEFIGGAGKDTVSFQGRPGADSVRAAGDRSRPIGPGMSFEYLPTGLTTHLLSSESEVISLALGDGDDVCDVSWDQQFAGVDDVTIDAGDGDDVISIHGEIVGDRGDGRDMASRKALYVFGGAGDDDLQGNVATTAVTQLDVILGGGAGNDHLALFTSVGLLPAVAPEPVRVSTTLDGGAGDDVLSQLLITPFDAELIPPDPPGVSITQNIHGGDGIDEASVEYRDFYIPRGGRADVNVNLGGGARNAADLLFENVPVDGTLAVLVVDGNGAGEVNFEYLPGSGVARVGPTGAIISNTFLGQGDNTAHYEYIDSMLDGHVAMNTYAGAGVDEVTGSAMGVHVGRTGAMTWNTALGNSYNIGQVEYIDSMVEGQVTINMFGGARRDELAVLFTGGQIAAGATVSVRMFGFGGPNLLRTDLIDVVHAGNLRLQMTGGRQRDVIAAMLDLDPASTGAVFAQLRGGAGNDDVRFDMLGARMARFLPGSLADGGPGYDRFRGNAKLRRINFEY